MNIRSILAAAALFPALSAAHDFQAHASVETHALRQVREGRDTFRFASEPAVADLDGDGQAEVIFASWPRKVAGLRGELLIYSSTGVLLQRTQLPAPATFGDSWNGALGAPTLADLDEVYRQADFITLHNLVTDETRGMLNAAAFAKMKPNVRIVNCARGEVINETDLIAALESKKVAGAALDVFAKEPLPEDHPFIAQAAKGNLILTPHLGASTKEAQEKCGIEVAEIVIAYLLTGEVRNAVNLPYLDAKTSEQVKPYLPLGEALGKLLVQLAPAGAERETAEKQDQNGICRPFQDLAERVIFRKRREQNGGQSP